MTSNVRVVIDTNVAISAALLPRSLPRQAFDRALEHTDLPERPDYERANEFLVKARRLAVAEELP